MLALWIVLISILAAICFLALGRAIESAKLRNQRKRSKDYGDECELYVYSLLRDFLPYKNVYRNMYFPVYKSGEVLWTEVDVVAVTHAGVSVIEVKGLKGVIDSPAEGDWTQKYGDKLLKFRNPHTQNEGHVIAVKNALKRAGLENVAVDNAVVFTEQTVKFTQTHPWLFKNYQIVDHLSALDDRNALDRKDLKAVNAALAAYTKKRPNTAAQYYAENSK